MGEFWGILTIAGPIILAGVIIYAIMRNRGESASDTRRSEDATRKLYEESEVEDDKAERNDPLT